QQEYEAEFVDETTAWIPWEEIKANQVEDLVCFHATAKQSNLANVFPAIAAFERAIEEGKIEKVFAGGYDVGRTRHASELFLVGHTTTKQFPLRLMLTLEGSDFDTQLAVISRVMKLPVHKLLIDQNGIGRNLAESAAKAFPSKVFGVDFTNAT